ncbi:MAG: DUF2264 domain-containing protein [Acidobacteriota bacterium]
MNRREFLTTTGAVGVGAAVARPGAAEQQAAMPLGERAYWVAMMRRVADPVLTNLAAGTLRARMPVEQANGTDRRSVTHLEAFGRLMAGLAPWLELGADDTPEGRLRGQYADLARRALDRAVDPASPDAMNFTSGSQPLVDAAFLAQGVLRAPREFRDALAPDTRRRLVSALESTRTITPGFNNWLLFSAIVEAGLKTLGAPWDRLRVDYALRQHEQWYKGDGLYSDGPVFHWDYYNSFVIHPMLRDVLDTCGADVPAWGTLAPKMADRSQRYAVILERLVAPDGSFPAIGRSIAYRCGAFHLLAQLALKRTLPSEASAAQVRGALTAVIRRTLDAPSTFDDSGWLRIGLAGHQPGVGETYISTGSLYLCAVGLLPLGLPANDAFWTSPAEPWTSVRAWAGRPFPIDHAAT